MEKAVNNRQFTETSPWRYERKFLITTLSFREVESLIKFHPAVFSEIYHQRFVNNIYFDSFGVRNYFDNFDGVADRIKIRLRWYNDLFGFIEKPVLELKIKKGLPNRKVSFPFASFTLNKDFTIDTIKSTIGKSDILETLKTELTSLEPVLLNRYSRKYYQSADKDFRITLDSALEFYNLDHRYNSFLQQAQNRKDIILELKYSKDVGHSKIEGITNFFPFRLSKNSKYVKGLEILDLW